MSSYPIPVSSITPEPCSIFPWKRSHAKAATAEYTDADLAKDLNSLSFEERQKVVEEIHGVSDMIEETDSLISQKIQAMKDCIENLSPRTTKRAAWDRAVFLKPSLSFDRELFLMFLRARRFDAYDAAVMLFKYFEDKRDLWGDDLLVHRISWQDLTAREQEMMKSGIYQLVPKSKSDPSRQVGYYRVCHYDMSDCKALARCLTYPFHSTVYDDAFLQKKGLILVCDFRGKWKSPRMSYFPFAATVVPVMENIPVHQTAIHFVFEDSTIPSLYNGTQALFTKGRRIRFRVHHGSSMEVQYSLKTFGVDLPDCLNGEGPFAPEAIEKELLRWQQVERAWLAVELPYREKASVTALYPNPQDIIMGKNRKVASSWVGNLFFANLIRMHAHRYMATKDRFDKLAITHQVMRILDDEQHARFLTRKDDIWETVDSTEAQYKVSQALRDEARRSSKR